MLFKSQRSQPLSKGLCEELKAEGISNQAVLTAIETVPRHLFVPENLRDLAYYNEALPIGGGQTISQPYVVARMSELLSGENNQRVLEIGTGSGYQAAVLTHSFKEVYTIERIRELYDTVVDRFQTLGYTQIHTQFADGSFGWPEHSPFDAIIVTAAAAQIPQALLDQLSPEGGRLIIPIGDPQNPPQRLSLIVRHKDQFDQTWLDAVLFVPLKPGISDNP